MTFLMDTASHFTAKNRGVRPGGHSSACSYVHGCAIGRHLPMKLRKKLDGLSMGGVCNDEVFNMLPDKPVKPFNFRMTLPVSALKQTA